MGFPPKSSHFNRVFHYKPSILGYPYFRKHPYMNHRVFLWVTRIIHPCDVQDVFFQPGPDIQYTHSSCTFPMVNFPPAPDFLGTEFVGERKRTINDRSFCILVSIHIVKFRSPNHDDVSPMIRHPLPQQDQAIQQ